MELLNATNWRKGKNYISGIKKLFKANMRAFDLVKTARQSQKVIDNCVICNFPVLWKSESMKKFRYELVWNLFLRAKFKA